MFNLYDVVNGLSEKCPWINKIFNKIAVNLAVNVSRYRPHPWSTVHDYVSWTSLTDKRWSARHLPADNELPANQTVPQPALEDVVALFQRPANNPPLPCPKSTCLFPAFAQYLTDGFIRTRMPNTEEEKNDPNTRKQNTSNHDIDLSPLYGRTIGQTLALRLRSEQQGEKGKLKSQVNNDGEEYAPFLYANDAVKIEFKVLDLPLRIDKTTLEMRTKIFAFGGDRANASPQTAMMNTLFLREHNRLASAIELDNPAWDDERIFETARNANIVLFIKVVVEEYINHISPSYNKFIADPSVAWNAPWNKPNWITTEFSLLYRWHSLIPDFMKWGGTDYPVLNTIMNNAPLLDIGLKQSFIDMSAQAAGKIGAFNTHQVLLGFEEGAIKQGRLCKLTSYNNYRQYVSLPRLNAFSDISKNDKVVEILKNAYATVDDIEFYVGLFAEDADDDNDILPPVIFKLVAVDAFSQALTNPLLSKHVFKEETFSTKGWEAISQTKNLRDIVNRNVTEKLKPDDFIGMTRQGWQRK